MRSAISNCMRESVMRAARANAPWNTTRVGRVSGWNFHGHIREKVSWNDFVIFGYPSLSLSSAIEIGWLKSNRYGAARGAIRALNSFYCQLRVSSDPWVRIVHCTVVIVPISIDWRLLLASVDGWLVFAMNSAIKFMMVRVNSAAAEKCCKSHFFTP